MFTEVDTLIRATVGQRGGGRAPDVRVGSLTPVMSLKTEQRRKWWKLKQRVCVFVLEGGHLGLSERDRDRSKGFQIEE